MNSPFPLYSRHNSPGSLVLCLNFFQKRGSLHSGVRVEGRKDERFGDILTSEALDFVARLSRHFDGRRVELLQHRKRRQEEIDKGKLPDFQLLR
ncbi:MAG TPA: hypothetical protein VFT51_04850 [Bacillales bacterium]|nr:hypothetical protein [Bacillales bacterium]